jgi:hypothetical protein
MNWRRTSIFDMHPHFSQSFQKSHKLNFFSCVISVISVKCVISVICVIFDPRVHGHHVRIGLDHPCGSAGVLACEFGRRLAARIPDLAIKAV